MLLVAGFIHALDDDGGFGEGSLDDLAVGEDVEIPFGEAAGVRVRLNSVGEDRFELTVTNDSPRPVRYEAELLTGGGERLTSNQSLGRRNGRPLWAVEIPANGSRTLSYRVAE